MGPLTSQITHVHTSRRIGRFLLVLAISCLVLATTAWVWGINWWVLDLCANLAAQLALLSVLAAIAALLLRRRRAALALTLIACAGFAGPLSQPRLPRAAANANDADIISILVFNGSSGGLDHAADALNMLLDADADVIVLLEPSLPLLDLTRASADFSARYPARKLPDTARAGWRVVFTRWPHRGGDDLSESPDAAATRGMHVMVVDHPRNPFGFVQFNPESPRTLERYRAGNQRVRDAVDAVNTRLKPLNIPILAAGDMNATPTGWRSRHFAARTGLRRAKPASKLGGSYPVLLPHPLRLAIDDVWGSPGVTVVEWSLLPSCGSDHRAVCVRLRLPNHPAEDGGDATGDTVHSSSSP